MFTPRRASVLEASLSDDMEGLGSRAHELGSPSAARVSLDSARRVKQLGLSSKFLSNVLTENRAHSH
jgi:hypothetical protein